MRLLTTLILICASATGGWAQSPASARETTPESRLSKRDAVVLGLVEGITEFLPISSTGHLIITNHLLSLDSDAALLDPAGQPLWLKPPSPKHPDGIPLTLKLAADTYIVVIQVGAIAAVVLIFWPALMGILRGLGGNNPNGLRLLRNIALAFFPVVIVGLACDDWIDDNLFSIRTVIAALVVGAGFMAFAEFWRRRRQSASGETTVVKEPADLTAVESVKIGFIQCLALWPGMSRSMVTMVGGYFCGLAPAKAAEFSFLVGLPVLGGAAVYKGWQAGPAMIALFGWPEMLIGGAVAAVSAGVAVKFLVSFLQRFGLGVFVVYRLVLAAILGLWMAG